MDPPRRELDAGVRRVLSIGGNFVRASERDLEMTVALHHELRKLIEVEAVGQRSDTEEHEAVVVPEIILCGGAREDGH